MVAGTSAGQALCIYNGKHFEKSTAKDFNGRLYAKTTLADEVADSALVIRGTVISSRTLDSHDRDEDTGTVYRVRVDQVFKGKVAKTFSYFSQRDSGGFYLGEGGDSRDYLLFLNPTERSSWAAKLVPDAFVVNYNCGQSRQWRTVSAGDKIALERLAAAAK